jgi:hypothetical protein
VQAHLQQHRHALAPTRIFCMLEVGCTIIILTYADNKQKHHFETHCENGGTVWCIGCTVYEKTRSNFSKKFIYVTCDLFFKWAACSAIPIMHLHAS